MKKFINRTKFANDIIKSFPDQGIYATVDRAPKEVIFRRSTGTFLLEVWFKPKERNFVREIHVYGINGSEELEKIIVDYFKRLKANEDFILVTREEDIWL